MKLGFATTEFAPLTGGGAGVLVAEIIRLLLTGGSDVRVVLGAEVSAAATLPFVTVAGPVEAPGWDFQPMDISRGVAEALAAQHSTAPFDAVECQDFDGLAFWLLTHRRDLGFGDTPISVRFHGPVDLQLEAMGASTRDLDAVAAMERESFKMADRVVVPSTGVASLVVDRYGVAAGRVVVGPPVVRTLNDSIEWNGAGGDLVVVGRLSEVKGSHDMVRASVPVLRETNGLGVTFVGSDGWSVTAETSMRSWISSMIPTDLEGRFRFVDQLTPAELADVVASSVAVVAPSRFESFNLAVHEARQMGAPVVIPTLPAFEHLDEDLGALRYDGSVDGLEEAIRRVASDRAFTRSLGVKPSPTVGDPVAVYSELPEVRHERSQGGVSTAALARVEEAVITVRQPQPAGLLARLLATAPQWLVRSLRPLIPASIRQNAREKLDLDRVRHERSRDGRWREAVEAARRRGAVPNPRTAIVIPCFNQGRYVRDAILSVLEQTDQDFEIVVVNDGSTDEETLRVLDEIDVPQVTVLHQQNNGLPAARNAGIAASAAEFVVTLDADDELRPVFLERLGDRLRDMPEAGYAHCWAELYGDFSAIWATRPYNPYQLLLSNSVVGCVVMRRQAWSSVGGYDESLRSGNEDWDLWIRMSAAGWIGVLVREPLFRYRKHGVSMSVDTESEYESTLEALTQRLPEIYGRGNLEVLKSNWYPLISVLCIDDPATFEFSTGADIQHIRSLDVDAASENIRGKYVVLLDRPENLGESSIERMCQFLEANAEFGSATSSGDCPIRVVRTWSLFDPAGPSLDSVLSSGGSSKSTLEVHARPREEWIVPDAMGDIPVQRQPPEESGTIPEWAVS